jgi:hypothetical protein
MVIPIFLPHLGCGSRCIYCNQSDITGERERDLAGRVERALHGKAGPYEIGLFGGSIFGIDPATLRGLLASFDGYRDRLAGFRLSTKPVPLNEDTIKILKSAGVTVIELGIPCFSDERLSFLNRGHSVEDLIAAFRHLRLEGFDVALQVMVGLPGETIAHIRETVKNLLSLRPDYVRIYPLAILKDTPLAGFVASGAVALPVFNEVLVRATHIYLKLEKERLRVATMGLTDGELLRENVLGGAYHPAFGSLVKAEAFFGAVVARSHQEGLSGSLVVRLNGRDIPHLVGYRRLNLKRFNEEGLSVSWESWEVDVGSFVLTQGSREVAGTIFDALMQTDL